MIVAQALTNQRLVLSQISALNTTTSSLIESTSEMLKEQSGQIYEQAASATIDIEKLQAAFANIYATIDMIDRYKLQALDSMRKTIDALQTEVHRAQSYLDRAHSAPQLEAKAQSDLAIPVAGSSR